MMTILLSAWITMVLLLQLRSIHCCRGLAGEGFLPWLRWLRHCCPMALKVLMSASESGFNRFQKLMVAGCSPVACMRRDWC